MSSVTTEQQRENASVDISRYIDTEHPMSWSRQMIALLRDGHYREAYEILDERVPFVENQLRPYAECLAGKENHWTMGHAWIRKFVDTTRPQRILDLGCATGCHAIEFARHGHNSAGIDILPQMIEKGRELTASLGLSQRCRLVEGDIRYLDRYFDADSFDYVISCDTFEHLDDPSLIETLHSLQKVLRPGGKLIVQTSPGRHYYWFEPDRTKLLAILIPMAWLPDRLFTAYVHWLENGPLRRIRDEHVRFYRHEYGHINCMDPVHLRRLLAQAGLAKINTFAVHAHPGFKDEGCLKSPWLKRIFAGKSVACRNVFGIATRR